MSAQDPGLQLEVPPTPSLQRQKTEVEQAFSEYRLEVSTENKQIPKGTEWLSPFGVMPCLSSSIAQSHLTRISAGGQAARRVRHRPDPSAAECPLPQPGGLVSLKLRCLKLR